MSSIVGALIGILIVCAHLGVAAGANVSSTVGAFFGVVLIGAPVSLSVWCSYF
jgi:hypothetical protein